MKTEFSKSYLLSNRGCFTREDINESVLNDKDSITMYELVTHETIRLEDSLWFIIEHGELTNNQIVGLSSKMCSMVLPMYEDDYNCTSLHDALETIDEWTIHERVSIAELQICAKESIKWSSDDLYHFHLCISINNISELIISIVSRGIPDLSQSMLHAVRASQGQLNNELRDCVISFLDLNK